MTMKTILALAAAMAMANPAIAAEPPLQVSYPTDSQMDCPSIAAEVARMDALIAQSNSQVMSADGSAKGVGMASSVAVEGLARSGLLARVPGAGMFANGAANMARQRADAVRASAAQTIQTAETRKAMMGGMYAGKACDAAPAPAVAVAQPGR
jgi:hypothetical protein